LLGKGYLAFTVDQGPETSAYQGIVELEGKSLGDCAVHYFRQSEQLDTGLKLDVDKGRNGWASLAILLQRLPEQQRAADAGSGEEDAWRRAMILLGSATEAEMRDPALSVNELLFRLFHEDGVRVFEPIPFRQGCRCSREKLSRVLATIPMSDLADLAEADGKVHVSCEFCGETYLYSPAELEALHETEDITEE
jgi:molecular chaperone Hsp33